MSCNNRTIIEERKFWMNGNLYRCSIDEYGAHWLLFKQDCPRRPWRVKEVSSVEEMGANMIYPTTPHDWGKWARPIKEHIWVANFQIKVRYHFIFWETSSRFAVRSYPDSEAQIGDILVWNNVELIGVAHGHGMHEDYVTILARMLIERDRPGRFSFLREDLEQPLAYREWYFWGGC